MNGLGNEGAFGVAEMLKISGTITEIDVSNNRIGLPGATVIGKSLENNDLLKVFKVSSLYFTFLIAVDSNQSPYSLNNSLCLILKNCRE